MIARLVNVEPCLTFGGQALSERFWNWFHHCGFLLAYSTGLLVEQGLCVDVVFESLSGVFFCLWLF